MKSIAKGGKDPVPAVTRAFDILEYLQVRNSAVSLNDIASKLKIPRASAFRIMRALIERGYVARPRSDGLYVLGARFLALGGGLSSFSALNEIANPVMYELASISGQTVQLGVLFEYQIMYIGQIRVTDALTLVVPTYQPYPVNLSAGGKILVAHLDDQRRADFLANTVLASNTPRSIEDKAAFAAELKKVKRQGYAVDDEEFAQGIRCVAAPIFDHTGRNIASIGVTGHVMEITDARIAQFIKETVAAAKKLTNALGSKPSKVPLKKA